MTFEVPKILEYGAAVEIYTNGVT